MKFVVDVTSITDQLIIFIDNQPQTNDTSLIFNFEDKIPI